MKSYLCIGINNNSRYLVKIALLRKRLQINKHCFNTLRSHIKTTFWGKFISCILWFICYKSPVIYPFVVLTKVHYMETKSCFLLVMQHCVNVLKMCMLKKNDLVIFNS